MNSMSINTYSLGVRSPHGVFCISYIYLQEIIISHLSIEKSIQLDYRRPWSFKAYFDLFRRFVIINNLSYLT
jgi:hypothetical protein